MSNYKASYIDVNKDELQHWKYIKKIPRGDGTFQYIYEESKGLGLKAAYEKMKAQKNANTWSNHYNKVKNDYKTATENTINPFKQYRLDKEYNSNINALKNQGNKVKEEKDRADENFYNSPIGKISSALTSIGEKVATRIFQAKSMIENPAITSMVIKKNIEYGMSYLNTKMNFAKKAAGAVGAAVVNKAVNTAYNNSKNNTKISSNTRARLQTAGRNANKNYRQKVSEYDSAKKDLYFDNYIYGKDTNSEKINRAESRVNDALGIDARDYLQRPKRRKSNNLR